MHLPEMSSSAEYGYIGQIYLDLGSEVRLLACMSLKMLHNQLFCLLSTATMTSPLDFVTHFRHLNL